MPQKREKREPEYVRVIRVFVSSPRDVTDEREALLEVVERINDTDGKANGVRLELARWEKNVVPRIGPQPQENVDDQTLPYDVYLGIMWSRFGTPTDEYGSGTEHEFREAFERWGEHGEPWILFYFRKDLPPQTTTELLEEMLKVSRFRDELEGLGIRGAYSGVRGNPEGFFETVELHLRKVVRRLLEESPAVAGDDVAPSRPRAPKKPEVPEAYRAWMQEQCTDIDLLGIQLKDTKAVRLSNVYVPLVAAVAGGSATDPEAFEKRGRVGRGADREEANLLLQALDEDSLSVTGAPGSGKSTFCRWVSWLACGTTMPLHPIEGPSDHAETYPESFRDRLPVLVRLREFWPHLPQSPPGDFLTRDGLEEALGRWLDATRPGGLASADLAAHLEHGTALLILDGVDEVPLSIGAEQPVHPRAMLLSGTAAAMPAWREAGNRVLVTSRPYGIEEADVRKIGLRSTPIADLPEPLRDLLVRRWFHILRSSDEEGAGMASELLHDLQGRAELEPLTANPMLLTAVCVVYNEGKRLPQDKYDLYARIVDRVLYGRYPNDPAEIELVRTRLAVIAHGMHTGAALGEERTTPQAKATLAEVDRLLQVYREESPETESAVRSTLESRDDLLSRSGLLLPEAADSAAFHHLSLQEFLTAQRLLDLEFDDLARVFRERSEHEEWRNTLSFLFACLMSKFSAQRGIRLVTELVETLRDEHVGLTVVVGDALQILLGRRIELSPELLDAYRGACIKAIEEEVAIRQRAAIGLALGHVGDPRITVDLRDEAAYVEIPAGTYRVGEHREAVTLLGFLLSRYPVTNSQFALFMDEGGYDEKADWWSRAGRAWLEESQVREPEYWRSAKWNAPNQPVVGVSFWEAEAFAKWAGGELPTETEWEAAARGADGLEYPWGDTWEDGICNTSETDLGVTTSVGVFPRSRSAFGLDDLAGNVWEWCEDPEAGNAEDAGDRYVRVLRGGSWNNHADLARCALRLNYHPADRYANVGFRVLLRGVRTRIS